MAMVFGKVLFLILLYLNCTLGVYFSKNKAGLVSVPHLVPWGYQSTDVTRVYLRQNRITEFPSESLLGFTGVYYLDLYSNQLTSFPNLTHVADKLTNLILQRNKITDISYSFLTMLTKLSVLDLTYNQLTSFPDDVGLGTHLNKLYISGNKLQNISHFRQSRRYLYTFHIWGNELTDMDAIEFENMTRLYDIHLSNNRLTRFPNFTHVSGTLGILRVTSNSITNISYEQLDHLKRLRHLELNLNKVQFFADPPGLSDSLVTLILDNNLLGNNGIPKFVNSGNKLTTLHISGNQLEQTNPAQFQGLLKLSVLYINYNSLTQFPNLTHVAGTLTYLQIHHNSIASIPDDLLNILTKLRVLHISSNLLTTFPNVAGPSNALKELYLHYNKFTAFPDFNRVGKSLRYLYIYYNQIATVPVDKLYNLTALTRLHISHNRLTAFPDLRSIGARLTHVWLHNNLISAVSPEFVQFPNNTGHLYIYIRSNKIETFPPIIVSGSVRLDIHANQLICDNALLWVVANSKASLYSTCVRPTGVKGRWFSTLALSELAASSLVTGRLENADLLHDGIVDTCTEILPARLKYPICSPFPSNLLLKLQGEFDTASDLTTRIIVTYSGSGCSNNDLAVYISKNNMDMCVGWQDRHYVTEQCPLLESAGTTPERCTFECSKSDNMYVSFYNGMSNVTVCDVTYIKVAT